MIGVTEMVKGYVEVKQCNICHKEYTSAHVEAAPGVIIYVCQTCLDKTKDNFIWLCMNCGMVHIRDKRMTVARATDPNIRWAYEKVLDMKIIQGLNNCINCSDVGAWN